ncbi:MAG: acylneuraminate cytidylyltransferase family protein [candidate division KSB1 bacterium]|nr:acylneuraminate cytidylyltransferase family protein [candidate division KSB1 bacterium]MDZ7276183.1 acylneuraminate cytidylyltransferase family protein [candidate division KSB1 bacterium]MDZ7287037.1 acylneuraminate cytidylyltransferase family protein [candidate division KSB1 bacterium]MDZ7297038.1 acylneuraminate cytidylyltransferase family protein [candidate division KSB1 bacterium]MDZ7307201.1 acylneuraminate cytidylyltransferase family protein [candidate division KSB1 bacterium]
MVSSKPKVLALVPARGGSKSIPRKNLKTLGGCPLLAYSIAAGLQAASVDRVIVSTDDAEIAAVARQWGAEVPFLRPAQLARDDTPDFPVIVHALRWLQKREKYHADVIVQLRPTSPLRPPGGVDDGVALLLGNPAADSVRAVKPAGENPYKMWRLEQGWLVPLLETGLPEAYNMPRQKLPPTYWQTGHLDVIRVTSLKHKHSLTGDRVLPLLVDPRYAIDLDQPEQWPLVEWLLAHLPLPLVRPCAGGTHGGVGRHARHPLTPQQVPVQPQEEA